MNIKTDLLPVPSQRRSGQKLGPLKFIVCHDTGNDGSTAQGNVNYYKQSAQETPASAHYFVDDLGAIQCIPDNEKAWHVRYISPVDNQMYMADANDDALGIELCFGSTWPLAKNMQAYQNYVELIASLCTKYKLDPLKCLVAHQTLDPTRRTDPLNAFKYIGKTWMQFITDVAAKTAPAALEEMIAIQVPKSKVEKVLAYLKTI